MSLKDDLSTKLKRDLRSADEIQLTVVGRKSGRKIPRPVWFGLQGEKLLLLPVSGSKTQWYRNVSKDPNVEISVGKDVYKLHAKTVSNQQRIGEIVGKFKEKYGDGDIKRYYRNFDSAVELSLSS